MGMSRCYSLMKCLLIIFNIIFLVSLSIKITNKVVNTASIAVLESVYTVVTINVNNFAEQN